jgi:protein phosphatase
VNKPPQAVGSLAIVCDGIGGHQGGNVASNLAIETIYHQVQQLTTVSYDHIEPSILLADLDHAVAIANDKISQRNDSENRQARQRMGTTVVMALPIAHEMYITHVGDSRAYWITRHGCYQVTLDDDVASREVRLGYAIYREAVQQGGAGSLVQALGMSPSDSLHPTSQRFILDEDAIFLLTSDGLSDFDRVEDYWETEILPILHGQDDIVQVADKLVELANTRNGHDNVTLALLHHQVQYCEPELTLKAVIPDISSFPSANGVTKGLQPTLLKGSPNQKTKVLSEQKSTAIAKLPLNFIVPFVLVVLAGSVGYSLKGSLEEFARSVGILPPKTAQSSSTAPAIKPPFRVNELKPGWVMKFQSEETLNDVNFPQDSHWEVIPRDEPNPDLAPEDSLVNLQLCSTSTESLPSKVTIVTTVTIKLSQLEKLKVEVLQSKTGTPCDPDFIPPLGPNKPSNPL